MKSALEVRKRFLQVELLSRVEREALLRLGQLARRVQIHAAHSLDEPDELVDTRPRHVVWTRAHVVVAHDAGQMNAAKPIGHGCEQMVESQPLFPKLDLVPLEVVSNRVHPSTVFPELTLANFELCTKVVGLCSNGVQIGARTTRAHDTLLKSRF